MRLVYTKSSAVKGRERMIPMTNELNSKELYQEIQELYKYYGVENALQFDQNSPKSIPYTQDPYQYQRIPTIYETVPTSVSNRS